MFRRLTALILLFSLFIGNMPFLAVADDDVSQVTNVESELSEVGVSDNDKPLTEVTIDDYSAEQPLNNGFLNEEIFGEDGYIASAEQQENSTEQDPYKNYAPRIIVEPSDIECCIGDEAALTVVAESELDADLVYQWYFIGDEADSLIESTNTGTFYVDASVASDYTFYCVVSCEIDGRTYSTQSKNIRVLVNDFSQNDDLHVELFTADENSYELSKLTFRNGMQATAAEFQMEPEFDPEKKSYTVVVPDTVNGLNGFAVWATLADTASGKIVAKYTPVGATNELKMSLTSGKASGQPLGRLFNANEIAGNTLQITVDDNLAYEIKIVRKATLKGLTIEDQDSKAVELTPTFDGSVFEYNASISKNAVLKVSPIAVSGKAVVTVNGKAVENGTSEITPTWDSSQKATLEIEVGGDSAESSKYTIHLQQIKEAEVPEKIQLSKLTFRNGIQATAAEFQMEPEFDPEKKSYTVVVPDTVNGLNGFAVWATLADTASGKIVAKYTPVGATNEIKMSLTSGKASGQPLGRLFNANEIAGNTLQITVDDNLAYEIKIVRKATLKGLTIEDQDSKAVELTPTFDGSVFEYNASISKNAVLKVSPIAVSGKAVVAVNGKAVENGTSEITPTWDSSQKATLEIEVGGDSAESNKYTVLLSIEEQKVQKIEIVTIPQRIEYREGESFDPTGMSVKAYFEDGTSKVVDNNILSFSPDGPLDIACTEITISYKNAKVGLEISVIHALSGDGTANNPYIIASISDFETIRSEVKSGNSFKGCYFSIVQDISFSKDWVPIGCLKDGLTSTGNGTNILPFSGILNGNGKTLFFASGCKPLFNYVREASVSNLFISAPFMDGYALVDKYTVDYGEDGDYATGTGGSYEPGCPDTINIDNVTIVSGSIIKAGGYIGGFASGGNTVNMTNCVVQKDVKIGCNADGTSAGNAQVGSFGGMVSGTFRNCISYADVYGSTRVGGIVGYKGQSMGLFSVEGCKFYGTIVASGDYVGGIVGAGYSASSAPNTMCVVIEQCESSAIISGHDYVGGILGAERAIQCWDNGVGRICNNTFSGKINCQGDNAGGIIGFMASLNRHTIVENNYYAAGCGTESGIGKVQYVDTNCATHETSSGTVYFDTSKELPPIPGVAKENHNRTDDPLGADKDKLCYSEKRTEAYVKSISVSGTYKTEYLTDEKFDETGIIVTATWSNGDVTRPAIREVTFTGFDSSEPGDVTITAKYKDASTTFVLHIKPKSDVITVKVSVLGDAKHGDTGSVHGLRTGGLTSWIDEMSIEAKTSETVWDVLKRVFDQKGLSADTSFNSTYGSIYIKSINGLGEFDNGKFSGWMYTVNGTHPQVGVSKKYLKQGDVIILHYTDDYTKEEGGMAPAEDTGTAQKVIDLINKIGTVTYTDACKQRIDAARSAYNALTDVEKSKVFNYSTLTKAEAEYKRLMQAGATDVDNLIGKIGTVTANSGPAINNAWNAYNALTAEQKALVKNFNTLQEATQKWNQLKADEVVKLIDKIEEPVTEKSKASIEAARKAYDGLTDAQKRLVTNTKKLTDAEKAYAQLTATPEDKEDAQKVIDLIKKLTNVTLDSEKDIQAARKAYDALTDLQKLLVDNYDVLTTAETKLAMLKAMGKVSDPYISTGDYMEKLGTPGIGAVGGEWMVIGLARSGRTVPGVEDYYKKALEYIESSIDPETGRLHKAKSTDNARMILALTAIGKDVTNVGGHNLLQGLSDLEYVKYQGNNGPIWALLALDSGNYPAPTGGTTTRQALIDELLRVQTSDGGWAITGDKADSDMTGMALTALAPYYKKDLRVQQAIDKAVARLSEMQDADGGFSTSYGDGKMVATSESISQVVTALSALGINPDTDERFIKNGSSAIDALLRYYVTGGGFKHVMDGEVDGMGTEQAYYALTAYYRFLSGKTNLYDMTDIINMGGDPVELTTEPTVPATTEPAQVEQTKASYPWWILVICIFGGCGWGVAIMLIIPKLKKKKD